MVNRPTLALAALLPLLAAGCAQTRRYNVQVLNQTPDAITIGLAKEGGPLEPHLASPEQAALSTPASDENLWPSKVVEPGRIGYTRVEGKFGGGSELLLRLYAGNRTLSDVLSIGRGSSERAELVLEPEPTMNKVVVIRQDGRLQANPVERLPATQPAAK